MKRFLWSSTGDLATVFQKFQRFWNHQRLEIAAKEEGDKIKVSTFTLKPVYVAIREQVSSRALQLLEDEHRNIRVNSHHEPQRPGGRCPCGFTTSHGLPCRHIIFERILANKTVTLEDFDPFWHRTGDEGISPNIAPLEPLMVRSKGRPKGSLNLDNTSRVRSTRRDPSHHEHVERAERAEAVRDSVPPAITEKRGLEFIEEYGDSYEPGTQMQRGYQRAARRTPAFDDEARESPIQNNLTDKIDLVPPANLPELSVIVVLRRVFPSELWASPFTTTLSD